MLLCKSHGDPMHLFAKLRPFVQTSLISGFIALAAATVLMPQSQAATLFDELGGESGLTRIAGDTIDNALIDPRIKASFDNVNIPRLKHRLYLKFCSLSSGPCVYKGRDMQHVHAGLHLHDSDFNALAEDLEIAMEKAEVPYSVQSRFLKTLAPIETQIVAH